MDSLLKAQPPARGFWAVDKLMFAYFAFTTALILGWWREIPEAGRPFRLAHCRHRPAAFRNQTPQSHKLAFPLLVSPALRGRLLQGDGGAHPAHPAHQRRPVAGRPRFPALGSSPDRLAGAHSNARADRISADRLYTFRTGSTAGGVLLWYQRRYREFQYYAFLIAFGYLVSYVGYLLVPARGPRFLLRHLQHIPLQGLWLFRGMQDTLDRLESAHYDCFPSGHTELTILAWWSSRMVGNRLFWVYFAYTPSIIFATVYLRYHYSVDVLAGAIVATALILATPSIYRRLQERA